MCEFENESKPDFQILCSLLRQDGTFHRVATPIIYLMTAMSDDEVAELRERCNNIFKKPGWSIESSLLDTILSDNLVSEKDVLLSSLIPHLSPIVFKRIFRKAFREIFSIHQYAWPLASGLALFLEKNNSMANIFSREILYILKCSNKKARSEGLICASYLTKIPRPAIGALLVSLRSKDLIVNRNALMALLLMLKSKRLRLNTLSKDDLTSLRRQIRVMSADKFLKTFALLIMPLL